MKAITIWQPWASLIHIGAKTHEFRNWPLPEWMIGQDFVNHAGMRTLRGKELVDLVTRLKSGRSGAWSTGLKPEIALPLLERIARAEWDPPFGAGLGVGRFGKPVLARDIAPAGDSDRVDQHVWAWPIENYRPFSEPVESKGAQGFWDWSREIAA